LIVVLVCTSILDDVAFPRNIRIEVWVRILPPPEFIALPVVAEDNVEVAVTIDVVAAPPASIVRNSFSMT
jgi:hypothetical protein